MLAVRGHRVLTAGSFFLKCALLLSFAFVAGPLHSDTTMEQEFRVWVEKEDMAPASLFALDTEGRVFAKIAIGTEIDTPLPIASISKTIAGHCAVYLDLTGVIALNDPISKYLDWPAPQSLVTLAQLLTHSSGFGPDRTQNPLLGRIRKSERRTRRLVDRIRSRSLAGEPDIHSYNNENYLVLERVLTAALGEESVTWCLREVPSLKVLESLGIAPELAAIGMAGGFQVSAEDLTGFFRNLELSSDWPLVRLDKRNAYGPGVVVQNVDQGENLFHTGGYCEPFGIAIGAFAGKLHNGSAFAMIYTGCADTEDVRTINNMILEHLH